MKYKCLSQECNKTFFIPGRLTTESKPRNQYSDVTRELFDVPVCPFCKSLEFEEIKE